MEGLLLSIKRSQSGSRILATLEAIATHQPIGVSALARLLDEDKSAVQRALMTLADEGWIRTTIEPPTRWEVTAHIFAVASAAHGSNDLRRRARPILARLRDESGETVLLAVPDVKRFVIADVIESRQMLRMVPHVGDVISPLNTATGRSMLAFMGCEQQIALLGVEPDQQLSESLEQVRARGYAISEGETNVAATNLAAPIFELNGALAGAIVVCGPRDRLDTSQYDTIGKMLLLATQELSTGKAGTSYRAVGNTV